MLLKGQKRHVSGDSRQHEHTFFLEHSSLNNGLLPLQERQTLKVDPPFTDHSR